jgi:hypothetical protein
MFFSLLQVQSQQRRNIMNDFNKDFEEAWSRYISTLTAANERNKARVFEALAAAGITHLTATFDGCGDSGQIDDVTAYKGDAQAELPATPITLEYVMCYSEKVTSEASPLTEAVENLCYGYLAQRHNGWENNDGAFGTFEFDVAQRTVELEFNGRYSDYSTSTGSF